MMDDDDNDKPDWTRWRITDVPVEGFHMQLTLDGHHQPWCAPMGWVPETVKRAAAGDWNGFCDDCEVGYTMLTDALRALDERPERAALVATVDGEPVLAVVCWVTWEWEDDIDEWWPYCSPDYGDVDYPALVAACAKAVGR